MTSRPILSLCLFALFSGSLSRPASGESKTPGSAQDYFKEVKQRDLEREIAAKQIEVNRQGEDLAKVRSEGDVLKRSIAVIDAAASEASTNLERLSEERARLAQALEVATMRVEAEKLKVAGLKMLSEGQGKALSYTTSLSEVTERKAEIAAAELKLITFQDLPHQDDEVILDPGSPMKPSGTDAKAKLKSQLADLRKKSPKSQQTLLDANTAATTAIGAASAKLAQADAATAKADQRTKEIQNSDLAPVAAGPDEKPAITAPKATMVRPPAAASKPAVTASRSTPPANRPPATSKKPAVSSGTSDRPAAR